jgi:hypothetical protein
VDARVQFPLRSHVTHWLEISVSLDTDASRAPTETIHHPPTSELRAFHGMVREPGCRPRTQQVHAELISALCAEPTNSLGPSINVMQVAANSAKALEAWSLELIRIIQAGISREQLIAVLQYSATTAYKSAAELRSLIDDERREAQRAPYFGMCAQAMQDQRADAMGDDLRDRLEFHATGGDRREEPSQR